MTHKLGVTSCVTSALSSDSSAVINGPVIFHDPRLWYSETIPVGQGMCSSTQLWSLLNTYTLSKCVLLSEVEVSLIRVQSVKYNAKHTSNTFPLSQPDTPILSPDP